MSTTTINYASELVALEEVENTSLRTTLSMKECVAKFAETSTGNTAVVVSNIHALWEKIVGKDIYEHVHVRHLRDGVLYVCASHPAWGTQLKYCQENILEKLNEALPGEKITSISMSVARD